MHKPIGTILILLAFATSARADSVAQIATSVLISRSTATLFDPQGRPGSASAGTQPAPPAGRGCEGGVGQTGTHPVASMVGRNDELSDVRGPRADRRREHHTAQRSVWGTSRRARGR